MALTVTITNAGRAELINAQNTGTKAAVINSIGVSSVHAAGDLKLLTALPNERKRLTTFGGEVVADDVIHVTINDTTADTYALRAFGLYFESGTLFAVCSSAEPIMEKAAAAMLLQAVDITLTTLDTASIEFGGTGFTNPPATIERMGVVELATAEETLAAADATRAVTPFGLGRVLTAWAASFAAKIHGHVIGDIDGLGTALANKAAKVHDHDASDTKTGVFQVERIPKLSIGWITNLTETLSDKASALHSHTMAQVSGLVAALALKANLDSPDIIGHPRLPAVTLFKKELPNTAEGGQLRLEKPDTGTRLGGHVVIDVNGDNLRILEEAEPYRGLTIPLASLAAGVGSYPWTSANFNPDSRVSVAATNLGATWNVPLTRLSSAAQFAALPSGFTSMVTPDSVGTPGGYGYLFKMARRDSNDGWAGLWINHTAAPGDAAELYVGSAMIGSELPVWTRAWTSANFNPATKAPLASPEFLGMTWFGSERPGRVSIQGADDRAGVIEFHDAAGRLAFIGYGDGPSGNPYFGTDGGRSWQFQARPVFAGATPWDSANFNPASKADLNGWTDPASDALATGFKQFVGRGSGAIASGHEAGNRAALEVRGEGGAAFLGFHRPGQFATFFGLDVDNQLKIGGWSLGPNAYRVWTELNLRFASLGDAASGAVAPGLHDQMLSPAALWSFARSIGPNGYQQIPGTDLIIQWGVSNGSHPEGAVHAALPVAFGGGCLFACATPRNAGQAYGMDFVMQIVGRYLDRIVFYANRANSSSGNMSGYEWMAVGLARGNPDPAYSSGYPPGGGGGGGGEDPFFRPEV